MSISDPSVLSERSPSRQPRKPRQPRRRRLRRVAVGAFVVACLGTALAAPTPYLLSSLETLAEADNSLAAHYTEQPPLVQAALYIHAAAGGIAMLLTPVQFAGRLRRRAPAVHRWSGRVSVVAILAAAAGGLLIAPFGYAGMSGFIGFSALAVIWAYAALRTVTEARRGHLASHRRWGLRVIALTFAATTLRLWVGTWIAVRVGGAGVDPTMAFDEIYPLTPFLSWIPNLLVVEWYLRRSRTPGLRAVSVRAATA